MFSPTQSSGPDLVLPKDLWQSLSDVDRADYSRSRRRKLAFKTRLCKSFRETGSCVYGTGCRFAHSPGELNLAPPPSAKSKTVLCRNFAADGRCQYGARCQFIHRDYPHQAQHSPRLFNPSMNVQRIPQFVQSLPTNFNPWGNTMNVFREESSSNVNFTEFVINFGPQYTPFRNSVL